MILFYVWVDVEDNRHPSGCSIIPEQSQVIENGRRLCLAIIAPTAADAITIAQVNSTAGYFKSGIIYEIRAIRDLKERG